jgi:hypothetical protein
MATRSITPTGPSGQNPQYQFTSILAEWIGLNEAIVIQHLHTLLGESNQIVSADGKQWICRTLDDYQADFPFWDEGIIKRTIHNLRQDGLISARCDLNESKQNRSSWYTVCLEVLSQLTGPVDRLKIKSLKRRQARDSRQLDNRPGFVYLGHDPERGYKIGLTLDVPLRMIQLNTRLIHSIPTDNMAQTENELKGRFAQKWIEGEWFNLTEKDISEIMSFN